jgi:hypothetical protein
MTTQTQQPADELLAHALAAGRTIAGAAQTAGVSESTAYRRLREPGFRARVNELRAALLDAVTGQITAETLTACQVLSRLLRSPSEMTQLRAAKTMIELAFKIHDRDRRAGLLEQEATPAHTTESRAAVAADPEPSGVGPSEPGEAAGPPDERIMRCQPDAAPGDGCQPGPAPDTRPGGVFSTGPDVTAETGGQLAGDLSKSVTGCHGPAAGLVRPKRNGRLPSPPPVENGPGREGRPHLDQTGRLSAGLRAALERA